jgi:hypothetical protein
MTCMIKKSRRLGKSHWRCLSKSPLFTTRVSTLQITKEEEIGLKKNRRAVDIREEYFVRRPPPLWVSLPLMLPLFALCVHAAPRD